MLVFCSFFALSETITWEKRRGVTYNKGPQADSNPKRWSYVVRPVTIRLPWELGLFHIN